MNDDVSTQVREALSPLHMQTSVDEVIARGKSRRRRRRFSALAAGAATTGVVLTVALTGSLSAGGGHSSITNATASNNGQSLIVRTVAYTVTANADGTVTVWTKQAYFQDPTGLQTALRDAGFPVLMKVGEFCRGPNDDGSLDPSGQGRGVRKVMAPSENSDGHVVFTFDPKSMPSGTELFIGYLSPAQLAVTHGNPGSVERLVPADTHLICTDQAPPPNPRF
jgi:hypothetical protein